MTFGDVLNNIIYVKTAADIFGQLVGTIGELFTPTYGHTDRDKEKKNKERGSTLN